MKNDPYQNLAKVYDRFVEPANHVLRKIMLKILQPQSGLRVLEVGCGTGTNLALFKQAGCTVSGIDLSAAMLEQARAKLGTQTDLRLEDAGKMSYANDTFDVVVAMLTLHEMPAVIRRPVLQEMIRVVKPAGRLLCVDFHPGPYQFPKGWIWKMVILFFEIIAGREHFRNYRHFIAHKGLSMLLKCDGMLIDKEKIIGGGNIAIYIARQEIDY